VSLPRDHRVRYAGCPAVAANPGAGSFSGFAGAVEDAFGGADIHQERGADVGVPGHAAHVGGVELPGEQRGRAEHVPQAVPGPLAVAADVAPADRQVGALEDVAVEVAGPPVLAGRRGKISPSGLVPASCSAVACSMRAASFAASG